MHHLRDPSAALRLLALAGQAVDDRLQGILTHPVKTPIALFFGGIAIAVFRAYRVLAKERMVAVVTIGVVMLAGGSVAGMWLLVAAVGIIAVTLVAEHQRIEG